METLPPALQMNLLKLHQAKGVCQFLRKPKKSGHWDVESASFVIFMFILLGEKE